MYHILCILQIFMASWGSYSIAIHGRGGDPGLPAEVSRGVVGGLQGCLPGHQQGWTAGNREAPAIVEMQ